ncbi:MAG: hypothetical protein WCS55_01530 [Sulfuricurvum sp.]|uniref:hypothetical protein n=1 Tax=Sulfuricurvum sp. TaxID=2025608 RepID=UPI00356AFFBD
MKRILMFLSLSAWLQGASYDPFLLETQLSLLPKVAMLEKNLGQIQNKLPIKILIAYDINDETTAENCMRILASKFNGRINGRLLVVSALPFEKIDSSFAYQMIYALKANTQQLKKVHNAGLSGTVTALYDADRMEENGILLSVQMERTPIIMINAKILRENRFSFPDSLLEIARIIQ